jgi:hypothetical protein
LTRAALRQFSLKASLSQLPVLERSCELLCAEAPQSGSFAFGTSKEMPARFALMLHAKKAADKFC